MQTGDQVKPGRTLCIIEAMKIMNEIEAEVGGEQGGGDAAERLVALLNRKPAPNADLRRLALYRLGIVQFKRKDY